MYVCTQAAAVVDIPCFCCCCCLYPPWLACCSPGDDSTFDAMTGPGLQQVVNAMYQETSQHLLEVLNTKYLFLDHLKVGVGVGMSVGVGVRTYCTQTILWPPASNALPTRGPHNQFWW